MSLVSLFFYVNYYIMSGNSTFYKCCSGSKDVLDKSLIENKLIKNELVENINKEKESKKQEQNTTSCLSFFGFCYDNDDDDIKRVKFNLDYYLEKVEQD